MQIDSISIAAAPTASGNQIRRGEAPAPQSRAAQEDSVTISKEGREKAAAVKDGKDGEGESGGSAPSAVAVDKNSVVTDLQDTESKISNTKKEIDELKRQAETDESKKQELNQKKVKLDDLEDDASKAESKLLA